MCAGTAGENIHCVHYVDLYLCKAVLLVFSSCWSEHIPVAFCIGLTDMI